MGPGKARGENVRTLVLAGSGDSAGICNVAALASNVAGFLGGRGLDVL